MNHEQIDKKTLIALAEMDPTALEKATQAWVTHRRRDARLENPKGKFDKGSRWYPDEEEEATGTFDSIRSPSRAWPMSYNKAARSLSHCEKLKGAKHEDVLVIKRVLTKLEVEATDVEAVNKALKEIIPVAKETRLNDSWKKKKVAPEQSASTHVDLGKQWERHAPSPNPAPTSRGRDRW